MFNSLRTSISGFGGRASSIFKTPNPKRNQSSNQTDIHDDPMDISKTPMAYSAVPMTITDKPVRKPANQTIKKSIKPRKFAAPTIDDDEKENNVNGTATQSNAQSSHQNKRAPFRVVADFSGSPSDSPSPVAINVTDEAGSIAQQTINQPASHVFQNYQSQSNPQPNSHSNAPPQPKRKKRTRQSSEMVDDDDDVVSDTDDFPTSMKKMRLNDQPDPARVRTRPSVLVKLASFKLPENNNFDDEDVSRNLNQMGFSNQSHNEQSASFQQQSSPPSDSSPVNETDNSNTRKQQMRLARTEARNAELRRRQTAKASSRFTSNAQNDGHRPGVKQTSRAPDQVTQKSRSTRASPPVASQPSSYLHPATLPSSFQHSTTVIGQRRKSGSPSVEHKHIRAVASDDTEKHRPRVTAEAQLQAEKLAAERRSQHRRQQSNQRELSIREARERAEKSRQEANDNESREREEQLKAQQKRENEERLKAQQRELEERQKARQEQREREAQQKAREEQEQLEARFRAEQARVQQKMAEEKQRQEFAAKVAQAQQAARSTSTKPARTSVKRTSFTQSEQSQSQEQMAPKRNSLGDRSQSQPPQSTRPVAGEGRRNSRASKEKSEEDSISRRVAARRAETEAREQAARQESETTDRLKPVIERRVAQRARFKSGVQLVQEFAPDLVQGKNVRVIQTNVSETRKVLRRCLAQFHPDKHVNEDLASRIEKAEIFGVIQRAYEQANNS